MKLNRRQWFKKNGILVPGGILAVTGIAQAQRHLPVIAAKKAAGGSSDSPGKADLVAYWRLEEASGTRTDEQGTVNLTDNNTVTQATGLQGNAADFDSANSEYLSATDPSQMEFIDEDWCMNFWVKFDTFTSNRDLVTKYSTSGANREYMLRYNNSTSRFQFFVSNNGTSTTSVSADTFGVPSTGTWYMIYAYHDSVNNEIGISVNNGIIDTAAHSTGMNQGTADFMLGYRASGAYHNGQLDEVGLWFKVFSAANLTWMYNSGSGRAYSEI